VRRTKPAAINKVELPLQVLRAAAAALPTQRDDPLDERLFALECVARAGRETQSERQLLSPALLTAEDFIDDWETDVPHANVLGQALSTYAALDAEAPSDWSARLDEALTTLEQRHTKHGITTTPLILASVIRGVTSGGLSVPRWLLDAARSYLESGPTAAPAAELAEALARHHSGHDLANQLTQTVFARAHDNDEGAAIARWWLSERVAGLFDDVVGRDAVATARIQALVSAPPRNPRLAAMLTEMSGRAVGILVLLPSDELQRLRNERSLRAGIENIVWRAMAIVAPLVVVLIYLKPFLQWVGYGTPGAKALQAIAGGVTALAVIVLWLGGLAIVRRVGRKADALMAVATVICAFIPLAVALLYPVP
jgi:hypothetical protein